MNGKKITFNGDLDNFKTKDKGVTIQIKTTTDHLSLDKLNDIADGKITVYLESSQLELIEELDGEFEVSDIAMLDKLHKTNTTEQLTEQRQEECVNIAKGNMAQTFL